MSLPARRKKTPLARLGPAPANQNLAGLLHADERRGAGGLRAGQTADIRLLHVVQRQGVAAVGLVGFEPHVGKRQAADVAAIEAVRRQISEHRSFGILCGMLLDFRGGPFAFAAAFAADGHVIERHILDVMARQADHGASGFPGAGGDDIGEQNIPQGGRRESPFSLSPP